MGTPVAPTYANIVLAALEQRCLDLLPLYYKRFIDDLFVICKNRAQAEEIIRTFNAQCPSIQLEAITIDQTGIFLDMELTINPSTNRVEINLYQKKINKYLYIPPTSSHPPHVMKNVIKGELKRYRLLCEHDGDYNRIKEQFKERLVNRGYDITYLDQIFGTAPSRRATLMERLKKKNLNQHQQVKSRDESESMMASKPRYSMPPVVVTSLPYIQNRHRIRRVFTAPKALRSLPVYTKAFGSQRDIIIGHRLNKATGRFFLHRTPRMLEDSTITPDNGCPSLHT
jgi:hypothetical protein